MSQKRQFEQSEPASTKKRHRGAYEHDSAPQAKRHAGRADSSSWAKKRARAIERRLKHSPDGLPANVQQDLERELAMLRRQLESRQAKKQRAHMISKYHMIRFFERKKAIRLEKQLRRRLAATDDAAEKAALEADLHIAEIDRLYAIYFPFMEPYVSLYPAEGKKEGKKDEDEGTSKAAQLLHAPRPPLWSVIEATMRDGGLAALKRLQERQPGRTADKPVSKAGKAGKQTGQDKDDSDDGGFFE